MGSKIRKHFFVFTILPILAGCAAAPLTIEQQVSFMSDIYLCNGFSAKNPTELDLKDAEVSKRGLDCKKIVAENNLKKARAAEDAKNASKIKKEQELAAQAELNRKPKIRTIEDRVLADSIDQFNLVRNNGGSYTEQCVYAGMVKAAAAQAKNQEFYRYWNNQERLYCAIHKWGN